MYGNDKSREREVKPENQIIGIRNFAAQRLARRDAEWQVAGYKTKS